MDSQNTIVDEFKNDMDFDFDLDFGIDYDFFLSEMLDCETQEISNNDQVHDDINKYDLNVGEISNNYEFHDDINKFDLNVGITEFHSTEIDLNVKPNKKNGGWTKRKRLKRGTVEYFLWKEEIKLKNRVSARKSLEKKQAYITELEAKVRRLQEYQRFYRSVMQMLPYSKPAGRLCGLRRAFSTSDFYINGEVSEKTSF